MLDAVAPYVVALPLFAVLNTWEPFGRGRRAPYLGYITLRSLTPAAAALGFALGGAAQPVAIPGLAECVTIATVAAIFRLSPVRTLRSALAAGPGPRVGILRVSLPQIAAQSVMATGTLALSLVGAAASAGLLGAGVKILGGVTTLVGSAALASFGRLAGDAPADGARRGARSELRGLVALVSWLSLALASGLGLAAPLIALILLGGTSDAGVTTIIAVLAAIPPAGFVAALTSPLIAQRREGAVGATYLTGVAVVVLGAGIVLVVAGPSAPGMAAALTAAQLAMAVQLIAQARSVLDEEDLGELALRAFAGAAVTLLAAFAPVLRPSVLSALLIVALAGLGTSHRRLLRSSASALRLRADRRRPVRGRGRPWVLAAVLAPLAVAAGIAAAVLGTARRADIEALLGFDPYVALLVASLSVLALGGYIVWPSRWNVPAHIAVGFCISAYVIPILLTDTLDHFPTSTVRDYAKLVGLGAAAHVVGLVVARRRWGGRPPALLRRLLAPRLPADRTLAERTTNVLLVAGAGLTLGFALAGFVPLLAADPLSAKLLPRRVPASLHRHRPALPVLALRPRRARAGRPRGLVGHATPAPPPRRTARVRAPARRAQSRARAHGARHVRGDPRRAEEIDLAARGRDGDRVPARGRVVLLPARQSVRALELQRALRTFPERARSTSGSVSPPGRRTCRTS